MLTDVFFRRCANRPMFESVRAKESAFFVQAYRIVNEQIWKYYGYNQKVNERVKKIWTDVHDRVAMEVGVTGADKGGRTRISVAVIWERASSLSLRTLLDRTSTKFVERFDSRDSIS